MNFTARVAGLAASLSLVACATQPTAAEPAPVPAPAPAPVPEASVAPATSTAPAASAATPWPQVSRRLVDLQLITAIEHGRLDGVQAALTDGANPNALIEYDDEFVLPLVYTVGYAYDDAIVLALLAHGADPNGRDLDGATPLLALAGDGFAAQVEVLLEHGAALSQTGGMGETPLHAAASDGNLQVLELLLAKGHPLDPVDHCAYTPFLEACKAGSVEVILALAARGADLHAVDYLDRTGLLLAGFGDPEVLDCLLQLGLDPDRRDSNGRSLVHCVEGAPSVAAAEACLAVLRAHGVDVSRRDADGNTCLDRLDAAQRAAERKHADTLLRLRQLREVCEAALADR